ncbi:MAG TPA: carboxypeptidase regulatory-like domain-containing protein [Longimicrobiales bacterium]|nr:carboxypeptidase regulatory-like domain-containing protein [Longimicrobiales bacterium]
MRPMAIVVVVVAFTGWRTPPAPSSSGPEASLSARRASVSGHVVVSASPPLPPATLSPYARRRYEPPQRPGVPGGAEDAFVYLEPLDGAPPKGSGASPRIVQRDRTIIPHVTVTQVGQLVEFPNEDDVFHSLFSLSPGNRFSLGRYGPGVTETNRFQTPGVVRLFCDIHSEMAGVILVLDTPHVTRVGADGAYQLTGLPAGTYRAIAWHPTAGADTVTVTLGATESVVQDFLLRARR